MTEETKQSIEYVIGKLGDAVEALGGPASHVYEILIRQSIVEGVQGLVVAAIALGALIVTVKGVKYGWRLDDEGHPDAGLVCGASVIGSITCLIVGVVHIYSAIPNLINPEFYAIKFLMDRML